MTDIVNHKEALELAYIQRENSNMARSYLELHDELAAAKALLRELIDRLDGWREKELCARIRAALGDESPDQQTNDAAGNQP